MTAYSDWVSQNPSAAGSCADVTLAMCVAFPELVRVRGHYVCPYWGRRQHWWTVSPEGCVVDPTASQFPSGGGGEYEPWNEGAEEPCGKCLNCGGLVYASSDVSHDFCSHACAVETVARM